MWRVCVCRAAVLPVPFFSLLMVCPLLPGTHTAFSFSTHPPNYTRRPPAFSVTCPLSRLAVSGSLSQSLVSPSCPPAGSAPLSCTLTHPPTPPSVSCFPLPVSPARITVSPTPASAPSCCCCCPAGWLLLSPAAAIPRPPALLLLLPVAAWAAASSSSSCCCWPHHGWLLAGPQASGSASGRTTKP